ncbi:hypothetical protein SPRG_18128 [Saprolegnia parasitica CBS 223.65]|uniref:MsrB domain-containing protein n=1 Tax=Saprolegnia parasitica (strain CBS 223.65) TaxID=695850 RepID=A0A067BHY2_SAPPC|nr:hypothetical protein SPRG_18128 [Saprolegnia parasitica CBS 223.65]KDO16340.1 hypothetical protein SPRG_18128 [Saprolegnia parasitica CBS 223.65]|eukprot:XP_012212951.1 hypothetical protein SPRG_18128 [Saprolegnia parasitica CBS 223.65]
MGHVFENEGFPTPTNHRHCVNSISIKFQADETPMSLDEDGCGILRRVDGAKYGQFYDGASDHVLNPLKNRSTDTRLDGQPGQLLVGFSFGGNGFANYRTGQQRFVATDADVLVAGEDGEILQHYRWDPTSATTLLRRPIDLQLNSVMALQCSSQAAIQLTVKHHSVLVFELGRPVRESYLNKIQHRRVDGSLELAIPRPSLVDRQDRQNETPTKKAQRYNWHLPRVSASGREVDKVRVRSHLQPLVETNKSLVLRLKAYTTAIGQNVNDQVEAQRSIPCHSFFSPIKRQQSYIPSAKIVKPKAIIKTLPRLHPRFLDHMVARMKSTQLLVVVCSNLSTSDCVQAERMLATIEVEWATDDTTYDDPIGRIGARRSNASCRRPVDDDTPPLHNHGAYEDPAPDRALSAKRIVLADCSTSTLLSSRHNFRVYPMFLMYYGGQLGFCANTFNGFGRSANDFAAQVKTTLRSCQRNQFLAANFRFPSMDDPIVS